jgi:hypothetical protein
MKGTRIFWTNSINHLRLPVPSAQSPLSAIILACEIHPLLDLRAVSDDERLAGDLIGDLRDVLVGEAALEVLFERRLKL